MKQHILCGNLSGSRYDLEKMSKYRTVFFLFLVIVLEGYVVLSTELLAIRQSIPYAGSGTETVSVIIAAVLMPLAFGYQAGGRFIPRPGFGVRRKLVFNILVSMFILLPGLSYSVLGDLHKAAVSIGITHRLALVSLYSLLFIVTPVYLLGQTIPLISHYFGKAYLPRITGKILFFSTLGSFAGAVFSTLVLMSHIGVNNTVSVNFVILAGLVFVLARRKVSGVVLAAITVAALAVWLNSDAMEHAQGGIIQHNLYNSIAIRETPQATHLLLNNSPSSKYSDTGEKYLYIELAEKWMLEPILEGAAPKDILVIGAGAFTFGYEDEFNHYDFVDIDRNLKEVAENYILPAPLTDNKAFHPVPARAFLAQTDKKYDAVLLDTYFGKISLPEHLITAEFFADIKAHMKDDAVLVANFVASPNFLDPFSRNLDNTMRAIFPYISRHVVRESYDPWNENVRLINNVLYIYRNQEDFGTPAIYTDNKNRAFLDRP